MGIALNAFAIFAGGTLGAVCGRRMVISRHMLQMLGICVMFLALLSIAENSLIISGGEIKTHNIIIVMVCMLIGYFVGEWADIDGRISARRESDGSFMGGFTTGIMLFGIGGLQISGAISQIVVGDSSVLITKCVVDMPLAISFGALMGIGVACSALPVAVMQLAIGLAVAAAGSLINAALIAQLNVIGYMILFFSGFNMLFEETVRVKCANMLPALGVAAVYNIIINLTGVSAL